MAGNSTLLKDWMAKHATLNGYDTRTRCMKETGRSRGRVCKAYRDWAKGKHGYVPVLPIAQEQGKGKAFVLHDKDIDEKHDAFYRIEKAAKSIKKGDYYEDATFRDVVCHMGTNEFRRPSLDPSFDAFRGKAGGTTYWGHPESIKTRKERGVFK